MPRFDLPSRSPWTRALRTLMPAYRASSMGAPVLATRAAFSPDDDVTDGGERVVPEYRNACYFSHLSLYNFAKVYAHRRHVLDAGCGTGYGSDHLLRNGARSVMGIDLSEKAIAYCRARYARDDLRFEVMDLQDVKLPGRPGFGLIYCSNVLEHVADADAFLATAARLLDRDGVLFLAVPAINSVESLEINLDNPYHINNITPPSWLAKVRRCFGHAQGYRHWVEPEWIGKGGEPVFSDEIRENNFTLTERSDEAMMTEVRTIGTIIVARDPRRHPLPRTADELGYPAHWKVDPSRPRVYSAGVVGPIHGDFEVTQTFVCDDDGLRRIDLIFATYQRVNDSTLEVSLHGDSATGREVAKGSFPAAAMVDNEKVHFDFPPIANSRGSRFTLVLRAPTARIDNSVAVHYTDSAIAGREPLTVGGMDRPGNWLRFRTRGSD
jgi:SAM-dependent methyltransferase